MESLIFIALKIQNLISIAFPGSWDVVFARMCVLDNCSNESRQGKSFPNWREEGEMWQREVPAPQGPRLVCTRWMGGMGRLARAAITWKSSTRPPRGRQLFWRSTRSHSHIWHFSRPPGDCYIS